MDRNYRKWFSPSLGREMELLAFGHSGAKVLVFPAREGRFYDYEDWGLVHALQSSIEAGFIRLYCVDGIDSESLYCNCVSPQTRVWRHIQYERYLIEEVIPLMRSDPGSSCLIAHGCSIGAYHAINLALRHPWHFSKVVALSGRYDLTRQIGCFQDLFHGHYDQDLYFITPNHFLPNLSDPAFLEPLRKMEVILAVGEHDPFNESNRLLSDALAQKEVPHTLAVWPGEAHRAKYWREMVRFYL